MIQLANKNILVVVFLFLSSLEINFIKCSNIKFIEIDKVVCKDAKESLNITIFERLLTEEDDIKLTLKYSIRVINQPTEVNHIDYLNKCFKSVIFMYRINQTGFQPVLFEQPFGFDYSANLNNMKAEFENLKPLKSYDFQIGLNDKNNSRVYLMFENVNTCIGRPSKPSSTTTKFYGNGSILIKWVEPNISNSPFVCKYLMIIENNVTNQTIKSDYIINNRSEYLINATDRKTDLRVRLTAINDLNCYTETNNCKAQNKTSLEFIDMFESFNQNNRNNKGFKINQNFYSIIFFLFTLFVVFFLF